MSWGMVAAAGITVAGSLLSSGGGSGGGGSSGGSSSTQAYDPYAQYRPAAAKQLNALMQNPGSAENTSYGQAMEQAAARTMAAQGYTGSGNAIVAAANAGGTAYQQEFNNLVTLAGAGQSPASAQAAANQQANYQQQQNNQTWGQIGQLVGSGISGYNPNAAGLTNGSAIQPISGVSAIGTNEIQPTTF
jgi:hypothetical protein